MMRIAVTAASTLVLLVQPAWAEEQHIQKYGAWTVSCPERGDINPCALFATVMSDAGDNITIRITANNSGRASVDCVLPHGVGLEAGIGVNTEPEENRVKVFPYRTCNTQGCIATFTIDDQLAAALESGTDALIQYATLEGKAIGAPLALHGFSEAFAQFRIRNSRLTR